ncbi:MAG TPA: neutral/alkaline non-lysosomal ceramidase N-terminal domain-containing protein [Urbifossiella sp.]|nr:neutral/alkaline non-lysosomal ceramidase N-terminal domain-containing protein [Urbifossiella sp.]
MRHALAAVVLLGSALAARAGFEAGAATADVTPPPGYPMWGYAARKSKPAEGVRDPLTARALVLKSGEGKIALVSLDLGRAPTRASMARIRDGLKADGFAELFLVASHTHHGPVIELDTWPKERPYVRELEDKLVKLVKVADAARVPARYAVTSTEVALNRNRQSRRKDAPVDRELLVLHVEDAKGKSIADAVNFAAHPTTLPANLMRFSADFPGVMAKHVEAATGAPCLFLQGAAGDLSPNLSPAAPDGDKFGRLLGDSVLSLLKDVRFEKQGTGLAARREELRFPAMIDVKNPFVRAALSDAFFPELIGFFEGEYADGVRPAVSAAVLDGRVGFVGLSGEFFCEHALGLKRRARLPHLFVLGYCNDYHQYFPTVQAASEGGYGTGLPVSVAELGAGERVADRALIQLYQLRGLVPEAP